MNSLTLNKIKFVVLSGLNLLFLSCSSDSPKNKTQDLWKNTQKVTLLQENISISIPQDLKRSSRYRIKQDLPVLNSDTFRLRTLQNTLENLEFEDAEIDVFVDTAAEYHLIIIINTQRIAFDKNSGSVFNGLLNQEYELLKKQNPEIEVEKIASRMKNNKLQKVLKFKHKLLNIISQEKIYKTIYFVSTQIQSLVVFEFSSEEKDIEDYLWSVKD